LDLDRQFPFDAKDMCAPAAAVRALLETAILIT